MASKKYLHSESIEMKEMAYQQPPPDYQEMDRAETLAPRRPSVTLQPQVVTTQPGGIVLQGLPEGHGNVTVVTLAGGGGPDNSRDSKGRLNVNPGTAEWTTGLCGCLTDLCGCVKVILCPTCAMWDTATRMGETSCIICCVPCSLITLRTKLRMLTGVKGSICDDCCAVCFCAPFAICQMDREMANVGITSKCC